MCSPPPKKSGRGGTRGLQAGCLRGRGRCIRQRPRRQMNSHRLGDTGGRETGRCSPHIMLPDEGSEGGVQACLAVVGEEPKLVTELPGGDRGEGSRMG